jgi:hypothetical protein
MPNPNPIQTEELKAKQYKAYGEVDSPLAKKNTQIRLPADVQDALDKLPPEKRIPYLRKLISEAVRKDLIDSD